MASELLGRASQREGVGGCLPQSSDLVREALTGYPDSLILVSRSWEAQWLDAYFSLTNLRARDGQVERRHLQTTGGGGLGDKGCRSSSHGLDTICVRVGFKKLFTGLPGRWTDLLEENPRCQMLSQQSATS